MGLFDKLKKQISDAVGDAVGDVVGNVVSGIAKKQTEDIRKETEQNVNRAAAAAEDYFDDYEEMDEAKTAERIREVMRTSYPQFEVRENVSPTTIGGVGRYMNYSFGIYNMGQPVLFIMLVGKTTCSHKEYRWSKQQAAAAGVTMINFVSHYPNKVEYVTERLGQYLL